jgi:hypothetical protein
VRQQHFGVQACGGRTRCQARRGLYQHRTYC